MKPKVAVIILNWNSFNDTDQCLQSLDNDYNILLVDNASVDGSADKLKEKYPQITLIKNQQNLGFTGGNNAGIKAALAYCPDYLLLLNNDTITTPSFIDKMVKACEQEKMIGLASPKIMLLDDHNRTWFSGGKFLPLLRKPIHAKNNNFSHPFSTAWISGCCMLIKRELIDKIGLLDDDYFFNHEDVDYCLRARAAGHQIAVIPEAIIYHKFAAALQGKASPVYVYFRVRNILILMLKTRQWLPLLLNLFVVPAYAFVEAVKNRDAIALKAIYLALRDFIFHGYGKGSMEKINEK